jgi:homoserine kinase
MSPIELSVPASTSNLGPGFDAVGLALALYLRLRVTRLDGADDRVIWDFAEPLDGENLIARALDVATERRGERRVGLRIDVRSDIPRCAGLGSSAAAIVAGLCLSDALHGETPIEELLSLAAELEGHPDNTSAALLGGLTTSCRTADGRVVALAQPWPSRFQIVVATPQTSLETLASRAILPETVPLSDAVFNVQRVALLIHAVHAGEREALSAALADRLHQPYRASLVPGLYDALQLRHPSLVGVFLSGAGPSLAAVVDGDPGAVIALLDDLYRRMELACTVRPLAVHQPAFAATSVAALPRPTLRGF